MHVQTPLMTEYLRIPLALNLFSLRVHVVCVFLVRKERWTNIHFKLSARLLVIQYYALFLTFRWIC